MKLIGNNNFGSVIRQLNCTVVLVVAVAGCATSTPEVPTEVDRKLENCQISLDTCRTQRNECESNLVLADQALVELCNEANWQIASCIDQSNALHQQLNQLDRELSECLASEVRASTDLETLRQSERRLREQLKDEITSNEVEIQMLKDRLAVRVLDKILFKSGSAAILPEGLAVLDKISGVLADSDHTIRVAGHTDDVPIGNALKSLFPSNWELSATRAASVIRYMQFHHEIEAQRLTLLGYSKYRPVASNDDAEGRQRNRRVEIVLGAPEQV